MIIDAIVLAGGRASRLGGASKPALRYDGQTLLRKAIDALSGARQVVVVGDSVDIEAAAPGANILVTREVPAFGGPAAAIGAALDRLAINDVSPADFTLTLACDMPHIADVVALLVSDLRADSDGVVAVSPDGQVQHLAGVYSTARLHECLADYRASGDLDGLSVRALLSVLRPETVATGATDDVDTWADAERLRVVASHSLAS